MLYEIEHLAGWYRDTSSDNPLVLRSEVADDLMELISRANGREEA